MMSKRISVSRYLYGLLALTFIAVAGYGQTGKVEGRLRDEYGGVVKGARVVLTGTTFNQTAVRQSDESGGFVFDGVRPGRYEVKAYGDGFKTVTAKVEVSGVDPVMVDLVLDPATIAEEIVVITSSIAGSVEGVERIPGSVQVVDKATLETSRVFNFSEALRKVSGLTVRDEEGFGLRPNIGIRGLNPTRSTKVLLLEDGIPLAYAPYGDNSSYYHPPIERFDGIEVLKGSGQVVYGPVTVGGVINYLTPAPPSRRSGSITLMGGNLNYFNGSINYGGTWRNTGYILNYLRKQGDGARENLRSGLNDVDLKTVTTLTPKQVVTFRASMYTEDSNLTYSGLTEEEYRIDPRQNPFRNDFFNGDRWGGSLSHAYVFNPNVVLTTNIYGSNFNRHWWRQASNSRQRPNDAADPNCGGMANLNTTCGNEGRLRHYLTWGIDPRLRANFTFLGMRNEADLGFRYHYENQDRRQVNGDRPDARTGVLVERNLRRNHAYSGFIQNRFIIRNLTITPGVRIENVDYLRTNSLANNGLGASGTFELTQAIPGIGVSYAPSSRLVLFAGAHRGFAPPRTEDVISNSTGGSIDLDPELSWNYEAGFRSNLHDGLRIEATFFRMDYQNQIIPASLAGGIGATLTNGGETVHQGAEFNARVDSGTILRSRHNFYASVALTWLPIARFEGLRFSNISGAGNVAITGNRLPYAPEGLANLSFGYTHPFGIETLVEMVHTGSQFGDDLNTVAPTPDGQRGLIPSANVWNATVNYSIESRRSTFFFTVKNLTDRTFIVDRTRGLLPGMPRLVQAGVKFRF